MGEKYFVKEPESYITIENAEKAIDDAYKRGKVEMMGVIEQIKADISDMYPNYTDEKGYRMIRKSDVLNILDKHIKENKDDQRRTKY